MAQLSFLALVTEMPVEEHKPVASRQPHEEVSSAGGMAQIQQITQANNELANLKVLLNVETDVRAAADLDEWKFVVANETLKLTHAKQLFVFNCNDKIKLMAISGLTSFERSGDLASNFEKIISLTRLNNQIDTAQTVNPGALCPNEPGFMQDYPFRNLLWVPLLSRDKEVIAGMLLASDQIWQDHNLVILQRLADTYAHAFVLFVSQKSVARQIKSKIRPKKWMSLLMVASLVAILALPVSMSALAPFEIAPRDPIIVTAPIDGVIDDILVKPNAVVEKGQVIVLFADTVLKNKYELSQREVLVAAAQQKKASQLAFDDVRGQQEVRIAVANHQLKIATRSSAKQMLERATIKAQRAGVVLYSDKSALLGRPVKLGEKIMLIANPASIELQIDVGVDDAILLKRNAKVQVFLDSDPVNSRQAVVEYIEYRAKVRNGQILSYRVVARLLGNQKPLPGLGVRGTAKLYGEDVPLAFYLFRRPLSTLRQWIGI